MGKTELVWRETNPLEHHLMRGGKIVGRIMRFWSLKYTRIGECKCYDWMWNCYCPSQPNTYIGRRVSIETARRLVEKKAR